MRELSKEVGLAVTVAVAAALAIGIVALTVFPMNVNTVTSATTSSSSSTSEMTFTVTTTTASGTTTSGEAGPAPGQQGAPVLLGQELFAQNVSCSIATGTCTLTIVNESVTPLDLVSCQVIAINGTLGGPAVATGVPASSDAGATCTVAISQLSSHSEGSAVDGSFVVKLIHDVPSLQLPAGTETEFIFEGIWSN